MNDRNKIFYTLLLLINLAPYLYGFYDFDKVNFGIDNFIGFYEIFGFIAFLALFILAKLLAIFLKKGETYYDE